MKKTIIYQLLPRLFTNATKGCVAGGTIRQNGCGKLNHITDAILNDIRDLGATHVWYTGVIEHATMTDYSAYGIASDNPYVVKGRAGSPYAIRDYYDIDPDLAEDVDNRIGEFQALIDRTHRAGLKVVMDFVPNHLARRYHSDAAPEGTPDFGATDDCSYFFRRDNNFYYLTGQQLTPQFSVDFQHEPYVEMPAKATGNDCFSAYPGVNDWYETVKLNYGIDYGDGSRHFDPIPDTWLKMRDILLYWAAKGVDAFRCDMAHMVPVEFWQWVTAQVRDKFPDARFIAEIYDVGLYRDYIHRGGFDYLYDKVTLYDTLRAIECNGAWAADITRCWQTVDDIRPHMLNFLENHDEQRFASEFYAGDGRRILPSLVVASTISTAPMMVYAGQELGEHASDAEGFSGRDGRTTIFDYWSVPTLARRYGHIPSGDVADSVPRQPSDATQQQIRDMHRRVLTIARDEAAIAQGEFFDLMYVNYSSPGMNANRHYIYLRHHGDETLLIAVNFGDTPATVDVNIPEHAFDHLGIQPGEFAARDLLGQAVRSRKRTFSPSEPFAVEIPAHGASIWKLTPYRSKKMPGKSGKTKA